MTVAEMWAALDAARDQIAGAARAVSTARVDLLGGDREAARNAARIALELVEGGKLSLRMFTAGDLIHASRTFSSYEPGGGTMVTINPCPHCRAAEGEPCRV